MDIFNIAGFMIFADEKGSIFQLIAAAVIIITSVIASAKGAKKKQQQELEKRRHREIEKNVQSNVKESAPTKEKPQFAKYWGVPLEQIEENDDEYIDYDDDDDYDPLEPQPHRVKKSFAHKIIDTTFESNKKLGELKNKHLQSSVETEHLHSSIENQKLDTQIESLDVLSGESGGISGKVQDTGKRKVKIEITVPKGSSEALVHAVVLGEIFGPPITLREPYAQKEEEGAFKKSTLF